MTINHLSIAHVSLCGGAASGCQTFL